MVTLQDLKSRFMDFLWTMDFEKMDISTLNSYGYILKNLDEMEKPGYAESLALAFGGGMMKKEDKNA